MATKTEKRRTQAERRQETRNLLLEAALACLCEGGLLRFTTPEVCTRAGLSQGALFRYFPTKASLLAATSEHLFSELRAEYEARFSKLRAAERSLPAGVRLLWKSMSDPRLAAAFELYTAARTDAALREALSPIVRAHVQRLRELAATLLPDRAGLSQDDFEGAVDLVVLAMQGLVLDELPLRDPPTRRRMLSTLEAIAHTLQKGAR